MSSFILPNIGGLHHYFDTTIPVIEIVSAY